MRKRTDPCKLMSFFRKYVFSHGLNVRLLMILAVFSLVLTGCSIKKIAINKLGDALAESGTTYASDNDPELIRGALPFSLKLIESILAESPRHRGLLLAASSGFTQYSYAFVRQDADEMEEVDFTRDGEDDPSVRCVREVPSIPFLERGVAGPVRAVRGHRPDVSRSSLVARLW